MKMNTFLDFNSFNNYIGVEKPISEDIDIGYFNPSTMKLKLPPTAIDFYRISILFNCTDKSIPNSKSYNVVFFDSPNTEFSWEIAPTFTGMYIHLSKNIIEEHRYLFKNYLDFGKHEALYLNHEESLELKTIFENIYQHTNNVRENITIILSYVHVTITLIETYYVRQFSTNLKQYSTIVSEFQRLLYSYYNEPVNQIPSVQYFANILKLSPNYLGDIVKQYTNKSAIDCIHEFVICRAKKIIENRTELNNNEVAYELGFKYPNYFAKFFKKQVNLTPKEYRIFIRKKTND